MDSCGNHQSCDCLPTSTASQTLEEMDFERGIWYASQTNDLERVQNLIDKHTNIIVRQADGFGYTALHYAARNGHLRVVRVLVECGADLDAVTRAGKATALHRAASAGKQSIIEYLLSKKANALCQDDDGKTALHRAVEAKNVDICEILLKHNAQLRHIKDNNHRLPIDLTENEQIKLLLT